MFAANFLQDGLTRYDNLTFKNHKMGIHLILKDSMSRHANSEESQVDVFDEKYVTNSTNQVYKFEVKYYQ